MQTSVNKIYNFFTFVFQTFLKKSLKIKDELLPTYALTNGFYTH